MESHIGFDFGVCLLAFLPVDLESILVFLTLPLFPALFKVNLLVVPGKYSIAQFFLKTMYLCSFIEK